MKMVEDNSSSSRRNNTSTAMETDDRAKVAAAAVSVIPFSCIICFDEFHASDRPPMVLPCGHTYVCLPCTKRLKRCMECREPLFLPASSQTNNKSSKNQQSSGKIAQVQLRSQARFHQHDNNMTPSTSSNATNTPQQPTPLPIPKNLVLLSMMEAAQRQKRSNLQTAENASKVTSSSSSSSSRSEADTEEEEEDSEYELNKIITGMAALSGPCGTYAVREHEGLEVFSFDPRKAERNLDIEVPNLDDEEEEEDRGEPVVDLNDMQVDQEEEEEAADDDSSSCSSSSSSSSEEEQEEEDGDASSLVCYGEGQMQDDGTNSIVDMQPDEHESSEKPADERFTAQSRLSFNLSPAPKALPEQLREQHSSRAQAQAQHGSFRRLEYGQTVQVVSFYNGVAKLARDTGFIAARPSQLVKVGEPLDESCRLQGLLDTVSCRGKDLEKTIDENNLIAQGLQRQIERAFETEPSHPIISLRNSEFVSAENRPPISRLSPQTPPTSGVPHCSPTLSAMQTPKKNPSFELLTPTLAATSMIDLFAPSACKVSPSTYTGGGGGGSSAHHPRTPTTIRVGFADSLGPAMPRYADNLSMDDADHVAHDMNHSNHGGGEGQEKMVFGCGSSAAELFGENFTVSRGESQDFTDSAGDCYDCGSQLQDPSPPYRSTPTPTPSTASSTSNAGVNHHRYQRHHSGISSGGSGIAPSLNPSFSASFDVVDFRTGMSCHRALNAAKLGRSPKPAPRRQVRTMGDHRGVGIAHPIRSLQKRQMTVLPSYTTPTGEEVSWYKE